MIDLNHRSTKVLERDPSTEKLESPVLHVAFHNIDNEKRSAAHSQYCHNDIKEVRWCS